MYLVYMYMYMCMTSKTTLHCTTNSTVFNASFSFSLSLSLTLPPSPLPPFLIFTHHSPDAPGPPTLEGISMSYDSLMIQLTFSNEGTPPILSLVVEFTAPEPFTRNFSGPFVLGEVHSVRITGLQDNTQYSFTLSAVNYEGRGRLSSLYNSTTGKYESQKWWCTVSIPSERKK